MKVLVFGCTYNYLGICDEHQQKKKHARKIHTGPVLTLINPEDHVPVIGVTLCAKSYTICARAEADAVRKTVRDLRRIW